MHYQRLMDIMRKLRAKCPWDKKQTHESLRPYLIEEAYETLEAIDRGDPEEMREELGDLLLQIVFHSTLAEEAGTFTMDDVVKGICDKMVSRHPHVFADATYETAEDVARQWEQRKKEEGKLRQSILEGIPESLPALLRAQRLQSRAAKAGFDWSHIDQVLHKVEEEIGEFREAMHLQDADKVEDELGDILFALVNVSRFVGANAENALRRTIAKFIKRFRHIEMRASEENRQLHDMSLDEMEHYWQEAKGG